MLLIIGPRKYSQYAEDVVNSFVPTLCSSGVQIMCGLSYGVGKLVLESTLLGGEVGFGYLPCGFKNLKKDKELSNLARRLLTSGGKVFSPFSPSQTSTRETYAYRNKLMLKACSAVLVIEATIDGGTIDLAMQALEMGKTVFVVPGNIFSYSSEGCNHLLNFGALAASRVEDIFFAPA